MVIFFKSHLAIIKLHVPKKAGVDFSISEISPLNCSMEEQKLQ